VGGQLDCLGDCLRVTTRDRGQEIGYETNVHNYFPSRSFGVTPQLTSGRADRFLAATAKLLGLVLVTQDPELLGLGDIQTVANR
jgi:hypothetical protein